MTVLCLGYRAGFARAAAGLGVDLHFVVDRWKPELAGRSHTVVGSLGDPGEVLRAVLAKPHAGLQGVVTGHEQALLAQGLLRREFGLPGAAELVRLLRFRDKRVQKHSLPVDVARASCDYLGPNDDYPRLRARFGARCVLKPADGSAARHTVVISTQQELDRYRESTPHRSEVGTVVESFIAGSEVHIDGIWRDGALHWAAGSAYLAPLLSWSDGCPVGDAPMDAGDPRNARLAALATRALTALEAPDCVFHLEAFLRDDGELVLGEIAARIAGALVPENLERTFGVDLFRAAIELAIGRAPQAPRGIAMPAAERGDAGPAGFLYLTRAATVPLSAADFRRRFDIEELDYPDAGDGAVTAYGRWGHAVVRAPSHGELVRRLESIARYNRGEAA